MCDRLRDDEVQHYIRTQDTTPVLQLALQQSPFPDIPMRELVQQVQGRQKAQKKLPTWYKHQGILYPPKLNLEQTSSQATAQYKAQHIQGTTIADLTGGFGIDAYFLSKQASRLDYFEKQELVYAFAKANFKTLDATTVNCQLGDGIEALKKTDTYYDAIYIDPARRHDIKGKVFRLEDCEPNVLEHLDVLVQNCSSLWIKTAPLLDLSLGIQHLKYVSEIHIVSVKNEVKELLWRLEQKPDQTSIPQIIVTNINGDNTSTHSFPWKAFQEVPIVYGNPQTYLYEPQAGLMKAGAFHWIAQRFKLTKLHQHSHLYTSANLIGFPGRVFKIVQVYPYNTKQLKRIKIDQAHITTRNFKLTVAQLRDRFKIKEGGDRYLFFTTNKASELVVLNCEKC